MFPMLLAALILSLISSTSAIDSSISNTKVFLQLTDLHWDPEYAEAGGIPPSKGGTCRRNASFPSQANLGHYGEYGCDSPWTLVTLALDEAQRIAPEPDAILWTGDSMPHVLNDLYNVSGYYLAPLLNDQSLRVDLVGLNTNIYFHFNHLNLGVDPGGQLGTTNPCAWI